jgi:adenylate cyclase
MASTRRLAAILAADVAGYSRLMGADEEGTHERLKAHRRELIDPKISEHSGRIVKTTGDGMLAEFASVVDAVRCAAELQRAMIDREAGMPEDRRIRFRIGINLGDVIVDGGDIFGDGVNLAARLEALAEPGGICISRMVRDQVRDKLSYAFEDLGEQSVKNIARSVRVYALRSEAVADLPASSVPPAPPITRPAVVPRLSIVVLPFANLSNDPEQQYFADGISEDLTTDLSRIADMFVISRNTAFTYQGKRVDTKRIGRELCVRYVLEGSVRRLGNQIRINAQLIDAETDAHLWAERFDGNTSDLFALQNEITSRIAVALNLELLSAEAARPAERPDVLDYILRARAAGAKPPSHDRHAQVIRLYELALALDPQSPEAQSGLAAVLAGRVPESLTSSAAVDLERATELSERALAASPRSPLAHYAKGQLLRAQRRYAEAIPEYETVLASNRNWVVAFFALGQCKLFTGSIDEVIPLAEQTIRLSPRDPSLGLWYYQIGLVHLLQSGTDRSVALLDVAAAARDKGAPLDSYHAWTREWMTYPNGAHVAEVEIDRDTGQVTLARYTAVDDYGVLVNSMIATGQAHGAIAQGVGQALLEHAAYDPGSGQLLAGSFLDYAMPRADGLPSFALAFNGTRCTTNPLGVKGCGEAGAIAAFPAIANAISDARAPLGITDLAGPATSERICRATAVKL